MSPLVKMLSVQPTVGQMLAVQCLYPALRLYCVACGDQTKCRNHDGRGDQISITAGQILVEDRGSPGKCRLGLREGLTIL